MSMPLRGGLAVLAALVAFAGCGDQARSDVCSDREPCADGGLCVDGRCIESADVVDADDGDDALEPGVYRYVKVEVPVGGLPAELDAVGVRMGPAEPVWASGVTAYFAGATLRDDASDPTAALGPPDTYPGYPDDFGSCTFDPSAFVEIGDGGVLILELEAEVGTPFSLLAVEAVRCDTGALEALPDPLRVAVGRSPALDGLWRPLALDQSTPEGTVEVAR